MNREAIRELFDYDTWAWERIARVIDGLPSGAYAAPVQGSGWPSIAACLTHSISVYDGWLNMPWGLARGEVRYPAMWPEPVMWDDMKAYRKDLAGDVRSLLDEPDGYLFTAKTYDMDGVPEQLSPADILTNAVLHERGHHGDLSTLLHHLGVRSYLYDYRFFRSRHDDFVLDEG